jgi:hypothetical protein
MNKSLCRSCQKLVVKEWNGEYKKGTKAKEKVYVDSKGRPWAGKMCYSCKATYYREYWRSVRHAKKKAAPPKEEVLLGPEGNLDPLTHRKCTECNKRLPQSRYFRHKECDDKIHSSEGQGFYSAEDWGYASLGSVSEPLNFKISEMNLLGAT